MPQSSFSAKFLCRTLPVSVSNSVPSAPLKRRPHTAQQTLYIPDLDISDLCLLPFSSRNSPFSSFSLSLPSDAPARPLSPPTHPYRPATSTKAMLCCCSSFRLSSLSEQALFRLLTHLLKTCHSAPQLCSFVLSLSNPSTPPMQCRSTTYSGRIYTYTVYLDCNILAIIYVISTPSTIFYQSSVHTIPCCLSLLFSLLSRPHFRIQNRTTPTP
ncbi:hypothetical protein BGY98DRAFT_86414 [Russula aff. rugulosa BPL654]|nr:hypothetical protein BGY98DRAFT_86414 [Russula aff. rugulosa BPL654]